MLEQARARRVRGAGWKTASADELPFRDGWFDAAVMRLMVHTLGGRDRPRCARRAACSATAGSSSGPSIRSTSLGFHLAPYLPGLVAVDLARFPEPEVLAGELLAAGFASVRTRALLQRRLVPRALAAERLRAGYISSIHLLDPAEVAAAVERLEQEAAEGLPPLESALRWRLLVAER